MDDSKSLGRPDQSRLILIIAILALGILGSNGSLLPALHAQSSTPTTRIAVDPLATASLALTPSSSFTITINLTSTPPINTYVASVQYNYTLLHVASVDTSNNVLGSDSQLYAECIDGNLQPGTFFQRCYPWDDKGIVTAGSYLFSKNSTNTSGVLFKITFKVVGTGFAQFHIYHDVLGYGKLTGVTHITSDGYFTNEACPPSGTRLCTPPNVSFTVTPQVLTLGVSGTFNATATNSTNPGGTVKKYNWDWGDPLSNNDDKPTPVTGHAFHSAGNYSVTLSATDSYGTTASKTVTVQVINPIIQPAVQSVAGEPFFHVFPGTPIVITAIIINNGTIPLSGSFNITVEGRPLPGNPTKQFQNLTTGQTLPLVYTWDTTGVFPRSYRIDVTIAKVLNESDLNQNHRSTFVQLVNPQVVGSFSLGLFPSAGLGIIVLFAIGAVILRFRKKPSYLTEPL